MNKQKDYKICFVCTGNACRSPFAACVLQTLMEREGRNGITVWSRGTSDWGENPRDEKMVEVAREMGYELTGTTTPVAYEDVKEADVIVVFEMAHRNTLTRIVDYSNWNRIVLFDALIFHTDTEVMDPHFQSEAIYRRVAEHIELGCKQWVDQWKICPPQPHE